MPIRIRPTFRAVAAVLVPAAAAGCLSSSTDVTGTGTTSYTNLRFVQAVSDAANGVDVAVNGVVTAAGVPLGTVIPTTQGYYEQVPLGTTFAFAARAGTPFYNQVPAGLAAGRPFTLVAYGRVASGATPAATVAVLADTLVASTSGPVLVRAFNALDYVRPAGSAGGTPVDVYVYPTGATRPSTATFPALAFGARSAYATGTVGALQADVFPAGAASTGTPLFSATVSTTTGSVRTLVLLDPPSTASATATGAVLVLNDFQ